LAINVASAESGNAEGRDWIISGSELVKVLEGKSDDGALQSGADRIMFGAEVVLILPGWLMLPAGRGGVEPGGSPS